MIPKWKTVAGMHDPGAQRSTGVAARLNSGYRGENDNSSKNRLAPTHQPSKALQGTVGDRDHSPFSGDGDQAGDPSGRPCGHR